MPQNTTPVLPLWRQSIQYIAEGLPHRLQPPQRLKTDQDCLDAIPALRAAYTQMRQTASTPTVSVVLPLHVKESLPTLTRNFTSLFANQDTPATEVIAVLNGKATMQELLNSPLHAFCHAVGVELHHISYVEDPRYHDIKRPQNIFVPKQKGLDVAQGDIVLHADVDCYYAPHWVASYHTFFAQHEHIYAGYGPVYYDAEGSGVVGRCMTGISTVIKGLKITADFPPFAGHNNAMRRIVRDVSPEIYANLTVDCQIIASILTHSLGTAASVKDVISFVPGALVGTMFPKRTRSPGKAVSWIAEAALRNISNYHLHRRNLRDKD